MCGINAVINGDREDLDIMIENSTERGYISNVTSYEDAFIHFNWLPVTDASAHNQPFIYKDTAIWFNGFISNYKELAEIYSIELESNCDTELLCKYIDANLMLSKLNGSFAVLVHSKKSGWYSFTDRYGIKKLYCSKKNDVTYYSSELKPIIAVTKAKLNESYINEFKHSLGVTNKNTMYNGVHRTYQVPMYIPFEINVSYESAKTELKRLFIQSIERNETKMLKGVLLSGGIDSGIIANYLNTDYSFSVDYVDKDFSETDNIKLNSKGKHYSIICNEELSKEYIPKVVELLTDPKCGSSYTNYALIELASKYCQVIYSGAGGDEFFGGYPHRLNKPINEVIKRTSYEYKSKEMSHFEYDLLFLRGVLNIEDAIGGAFTMETRYPLLDNDLVNYAMSLPSEYKAGKRILKDISGLNEEVLNSKKKGFSNPHINNDKWIESFKL